MIDVFSQRSEPTGQSLFHDAQFEHAFSFVTKAYDVILSARQSMRGYQPAIFYPHYRNIVTRTIMAIVCDRIYRTELHVTHLRALPYREVLMPC